MPFRRTIGGRGKAFACAACGRTLVIDKFGMGKAMLITAAGLLVAKLFGFAGFLLVAAVIGIADWKLAPTRLSDPADPA